MLTVGFMCIAIVQAGPHTTHIDFDSNSMWGGGLGSIEIGPDGMPANPFMGSLIEMDGTPDFSMPVSDRGFGSGGYGLHRNKKSSTGVRSMVPDPYNMPEEYEAAVPSQDDSLLEVDSVPGLVPESPQHRAYEYRDTDAKGKVAYDFSDKLPGKASEHVGKEKGEEAWKKQAWFGGDGKDKFYERKGRSSVAAKGNPSFTLDDLISMNLMPAEATLDLDLQRGMGLVDEINTFVGMPAPDAKAAKGESEFDFDKMREGYWGQFNTRRQEREAALAKAGMVHLGQHYGPKSADEEPGKPEEGSKAKKDDLD